MEVHDPRPDFGERRPRHHECVAERLVETLRDVAGQLDVLALVVADRYLLGVVQQDVGRHQDGIVEQADTDRLLPLPAFGRLLLELRHASQLTEGRDAVEDPCELRVRAHVALYEEQ